MLMAVSSHNEASTEWTEKSLDAWKTTLENTVRSIVVKGFSLDKNR